jgi:putative transposase
MADVHAFTPAMGKATASQAMGLWRGAAARNLGVQRRQAFVGPPLAPHTPRPVPPLALDAQERQALLDTLNSERFCETAPAAVYATLLDEGRYLGSVRTISRVLSASGSSAERRKQLTHSVYAKPELLALGPNQMWSWDITKLTSLFVQASCRTDESRCANGLIFIHQRSSS